MNVRKIVILIVMIIIPVLSISAAEVKEVRYYSDANKTRITIELNDNVQYQTQFDSEKNIIIYLLNTRIGSADKLTRINDKLVRTVTLKENEGNVYIKTTLIKSAIFTVFSLSSPFRVVIDIIPVEKSNISGPINIESINEKKSVEPKKQEQNIITSINKQEVQSEVQSIEKENINQSQVQINESNAHVPQANSKLDFIYSKLKNENIMIFQIALDLAFAIVLSIIGIGFIQFKHAHEGQKTQKLVKKKQVFTDIINELENNQTSKIDENTESENPHINKANNEEKNKENKGNITIPKEYEKVYELFQRGMDRISISQKSNVPIGEVNLILDLMKSRKENNII